MNNLPEEKRNYMTPDELERFWAAVHRQLKADKRKRDLCLFKLMYTYGLRLSEVTMIRLDDLDFTAHRIFIRRTKRRNFGCQYQLSVENQRLIKEWLKVRRGLPYADQLLQLFISVRGRGLDDQTISWSCKKYARAAGLPKVHPHTFRHSCAIDLVKGKAPIQDIKDRLGHAQITSTELYIKMVGPDRVERDNRLDAILEKR
ncbi:MAG TPA: site-specific integrase [Candidatus Desulfaltia sp.]|nr:site-specific integrase [Candidatus Desulfaltia sp.]